MPTTLIFKRLTYRIGLGMYIPFRDAHVPMPREVRESLLAWKVMQRANEYDLVFVNKQGNPFRDYGFTETMFLYSMKRAGLTTWPDEVLGRGGLRAPRLGRSRGFL